MENKTDGGASRLNDGLGIPSPIHTEIEKKYHELIMAVGQKYCGESRHETALRYIRERETFKGDPASCEQMPNVQIEGLRAFAQSLSNAGLGWMCDC